ncbi:TPA: ESPR domain-containing protein [Acinetobacter baumannii]|nr:ESPR domain-containing protein [Acinetobacter baumannii]
MNKNRYRIIFSHARGMFIAVAEIVKSKTKQAGQSQGTMETGVVTSVKGLTNSGVISALDQLTVNSLGDVNNDHGKILSNKQLQLTGQNLSNQTGIIQSGEQSNLILDINGILNNQAGQIHGGANTQIDASSINNSQ